MGDEWFRDERRISNVLNNLQDDEPIYRIFSRDRFIEALTESKLTLVRPKTWDDPFENFLLSSKAITPNGAEVSFDSLANSYFGQCWSRGTETDAMWRIYSHSGDGIRVKTTVRKVFDAFYNSCPSPELQCYIGSVEYKSKDEIYRMLSDPMWAYDSIMDSQGLKSAQSLLIKRDEFTHESEVRLIYAHHGHDAACMKTYKFEISANDLFDEVILDPRLKDDEAACITRKLSEIGLMVPVTRSELYRIPNLKFQWPYPD